MATYRILNSDYHGLDRLFAEYKELSHTAWADRVFGGNAKRFLRAAGRILIDNGITHIPNIFGDIEITDRW